MKTKSLHVFLIFIAMSCGIVLSDKKSICNCCETTYTSIDSALKCIALNPEDKTTTDNRLLLFAFVRNFKNYEDKGWNIIKDQDIISVAKRDYVLIILDPNNIAFPNGTTCDELVETIKDCKENLFFVITNQSLYPFGNWIEGERKDVIIERLTVGMGP